MAAAQITWTEPELSQFYDAVQQNLPVLNELRKSGKPASEELWRSVAEKIATKTAEQLENLYLKQSNLLHVAGVTKQIFLASVTDLMNAVDANAPKQPPDPVPLLQPTTSLTATLLGNGLGDEIRIEKRDFTDDVKARPKRKTPYTDEETSDALARAESNEADSPPRKLARTSKATKPTTGRKSRRVSDDFNGEEGDEEGVAELLAFMVSPGKTASGVQRDSNASRRSDDVASLDEPLKDDAMDVDDEESDETEEESSADDPVARNVLEKNLVAAMRNSKFQLWCMYEWLYPNIDLPWYQQNEFQGCLNALNLSHITAGTRAQWSHIRSVLGRPRRFSAQFLYEQREELAEARTRLRVEACSPTAQPIGGLSPSVLSLGINERCIAFHPATKQILKGVLREKLDGGLYKISFDSISTSIPHESSHHVSPSSLKRGFKPIILAKSIAPPHFDFVSDDLVMSLRYNIATIDRLQKSATTRPRQPQVVYNLVSVPPQVATHPTAHPALPKPTHNKQGYSSVPAHRPARGKPGRKPNSKRSSDDDDSIEDSTPVRYYNPRRQTQYVSRRGRVSRQPGAKLEDDADDSMSSESASDEEVPDNGPPPFLLRAPSTSVYSESDVKLAARVFTLLNAKETLLQDLKMVNEEADRLVGPGDSPDDAIPDELRRAYAWLVVKLSYVDKKLREELAQLHRHQDEVEIQQPFLSQQSMNELSSHQKPNLSGGMYSNWYLEMGRACRRQVQQMLEPSMESHPAQSSSTENDIVTEARQVAFNAANMIIHITSCRNLPLSTEQVALALDAALSQLKPRFAQNRGIYAQVREMVAIYQAKITAAASSQQSTS